MTAEKNGDDAMLSVEEWKAMRKAIQTRTELADYIDLTVKDIEDDDHDGTKSQITLLMEMADTLNIEDLFDRIGGEKLPETPTWKTLADVIDDALFHL